jgi:hypothetical protein
VATLLANALQATAIGAARAAGANVTPLPIPQPVASGERPVAQPTARAA